MLRHESIKVNLSNLSNNKLSGWSEVSLFARWSCKCDDSVVLGVVVVLLLGLDVVVVMVLGVVMVVVMIL